MREGDVIRVAQFGKRTDPGATAHDCAQLLARVRLARFREARRLPEDHRRQKPNLHRMSPVVSKHDGNIIAYSPFFCIVPSRQKVYENTRKKISSDSQYGSE